MKKLNGFNMSQQSQKGSKNIMIKDLNIWLLPYLVDLLSHNLIFVADRGKG